MTVIDVVPVTSDRWPDLVALFESAPSQAACWCVWPRRPRGRYSHGDPRNREAMRELVAADRTPGLVALLEGRPVAWCALGPRTDFPQYGATIDQNVWAIACLFVSHAARGRGASRAVIEAAAAYALEQGASAVEGPPPWWIAGTEDEHDAAVACFKRTGFEQVGDGARMPVLRRQLG